MDLGISDELLGTFAPILVYWIYSGIYVVLGLFSENFRLHSKQDEDEKNLVSKSAVVKGVLLQQVVQAMESMKLKYLKSDSMMELTNAPGSTDEEIEAVGAKVKMKTEKIAKRLDKVARDSKSKKAKVVVEANNRRDSFQSFHNSARNFQPTQRMTRSHLPSPRTCTHCNARLFYNETRNICCSDGKFQIPQVNPPQELREIFLANTAEGRHFRQHIRSYNHILAFTSMGVHVDENLAGTGRGIYTFRAQGAIYHNIGGFYPNEGSRPRFLQLYIYDTEHELHNRMQENTNLHETLVHKLQQILHTYNPFVHVFRQLAQHPNVNECSLLIKERPANQRQYHLPTTSQVAAIILDGDAESLASARDIRVETRIGNLMRIQETVGYYDPLQYPLLLPFGTYGWDLHTQNNNGEHITCRQYYSYLLQIRPNDQSLFLRAGRLLQQYVVDNYVKIESARLRYIRDNQPEIRAEMYQGLEDTLHARETNAANVGTRTILPSSFIGGRRDLTGRYEDGMRIVLHDGKPDIFLTMTCNPSWKEITDELGPNETAQDRPDLTARIFRSKFQQLKDDVINKGVLGKVKSYMYVTEFQKRGLPHVHMLLILENNDKLRNPEDYDSVVSAEIPQGEQNAELRQTVLKHMIHGPCGPLNPNSPCMKNGQCKKNFPKMFCEQTRQGIDSYPEYRRRNTEPIQINRNVAVDNGWVVAFNDWLLLKYDCHINVEVCSSIKSIKYLYKYVYKGPDRIAMEVHRGTAIDEIQQYVDARWICAPEAFWKIFRFTLYKLYPSVQRLHIHLPNRHQVRFYVHDNVENILNDAYNSRTMLTEFFALNHRDHEARRPTCWEDLLTVNGTQYQKFKQSAQQWGLLESDNSIRDFLVEASNLRAPVSLRRLFATILIFCEPTDVKSLWDEFHIYMEEDYVASTTPTATYRTDTLLRDLNDLLIQHGKQTTDFDLPEPTLGPNHDTVIPQLIREEQEVQIPHSDLDAVNDLNVDQLNAFNAIMSAVENRQCQVFFVDGPGGTGKTFLYRALIARLRSAGNIVLATVTSGIAATLLPGGRTAHSRFKIPINPEPSSVCNISKQSDLAKLIRQTTAIIWDEAPMAHRYAFETLDRTFKDILDNDAPFGGKIMIMGGGGIFARVLHLRQNMRSFNDPNFSQYLLRIGDGIEPTKLDEFVQIPSHMALTWEGENSIQNLIQHVEGDANNLYQQEYLNSIAPGGLPPHALKVKRGAPLMLLRNIDPKAGLCNGTRLLCRGTYMNMLDVEILTGHHAGQRAFLPRIKLRTNDNAGLPFVLIRKQFSVILSFALTINKSQGQTISNVGIYLPQHVFSHGQLYVALSRCISQANTNILIKEGTIEGEEGVYTRNVVFKDVLLSRIQQL
ncbi:hypothetical protein RIF29_14127 [Crotalaria pallida]|uniref:ATP-dependent DNA helicase n=1 Tax=Crotalaria pallida TaxID=3830 RepID=A0AAN9FD88_CROPI